MYVQTTENRLMFSGANDDIFLICFDNLLTQEYGTVVTPLLWGEYLGKGFPPLSSPALTILRREEIVQSRYSGWVYAPRCQSLSSNFSSLSSSSRMLWFLENG